MRFSQEPQVTEFLKVYDATPQGDRKQLPFEAIALKAGCDFNALLGAIILSFRSVQAQKSAVLAMSSHPAIVAAGARFAQERDGIADRRMLNEAVGFLPTPKGQTLNFNFPNGKQEESDDDASATAPEVNELFPMITEKVERWQADRSRMLESKE